MQLYNEALEIYRKKLPKNHPHLKVIEDNIKVTKRFDK